MFNFFLPVLLSTTPAFKPEYTTPESDNTVQSVLVKPIIKDDAVPRTKIILEGIASFYSKGFHGNPTSSGERYNMHGLTAAHNRLPFGTIVKVTNTRNGKSVKVRINDTGEFDRLYGREIDLSLGAAKRLNMVTAGITPVTIEVLKLGTRTNTMVRLGRRKSLPQVDAHFQTIERLNALKQQLKERE